MNEEQEEIEQEAREITKQLESYERFSEEWRAYMREVITPWTKEHKRPLYYTYNE